MHGAGASGMPSNQPIALPPLRRLHLFALLAAFVLAGLGLAACGSDSGGNEDAQKVINETFNGKKKVESGKINMSVTAKLEATGAAAAGLKDPVSLKLSGPFQSRVQDKLPAVDLDASFTEREAYQEGCLSDEPDFSRYDDLSEEEDDG